MPRESPTGEAAWTPLLEPFRAEPRRAAVLTDVDGTTPQWEDLLYIGATRPGGPLHRAVAAALPFIALSGLTVGLILALAPYLTLWGSSALVVGLEFVLALYFARKAAGRWNAIMVALGKEETK